MLMEEFEQRTKIYPSEETYRVIEDFYNKFDGDKDHFCKCFLENTDNLALRIQRALNQRHFSIEAKQKKEKNQLNAEIEKLHQEVDMLNRKLDYEKEWKPYEDPHNVSQADYERLANATSEEWPEEAVKEYLHEFFGMDPAMIKIVRQVAKTEISRHREVRTIGYYDRPPRYEATDWHYARFNCGMVGWELYNDRLSSYWL